jgi:hypothetical protein
LAVFSLLLLKWTKEDFQVLGSQVVISNMPVGRRYPPYIFTEHGTIMAASVLTPQAVQINVFVR